ncbi:MAG TPA: hypothetical protein VKT51_07025 [Candidatus Eremiobacteraceae bacterium]|nr:hypothetical protein [Candidatus Eremiobacteraceae bacterium]
MSRMDEDAAQRFASSLAHFTPESSRARTRGTPHDIDAVRADLSAAAATEAFGRALTQAVATYLNRPVRVSSDVRASGARPRDIVVYAADIGATRWWVEFDVRLVWSFADAMLGGNGAAERPKNAKRCEELAARVAAIFLAEISAIASFAPPLSVRIADDVWQHDAQIFGMCAVGADTFAWRAGVASASGVEAIETKDESFRARAPAEAPLETDERTRSERVGAALTAACSTLQGALRCAVSSGRPTVHEIDDAQLPPAALRLALTAGGPGGALVLSAPSAAVVALASGVAGVAAPEAAESGPVVLAAAEAALRQLIREVADRLPRLTGVPQRIVHLAPDAQLARARCVAANIELEVAGSAADLSFIVPAWMTEPL